jgi:hypothetical protein
MLKHYFSNGIRQDQLIILADKTLENILPTCYRQEFSHYFRYSIKNDGESKHFYIVEPNYLKDIAPLKRKLGVNGDYLTLFKTIHGFKGLERDIIFLIMNKQHFTQHSENVYVGATRAKFKLHLYTYS